MSTRGARAIPASRARSPRLENRLIGDAALDTTRFSFETTLPFIEAMQPVSWDLLADGHVSAGREADELKAFAQANGEALAAMLARKTSS